MILERLKGKVIDGISTQRNVFLEKDVKSAVEGLIKFHEDRIEELICEIENISFDEDMVKEGYWFSDDLENIDLSVYLSLIQSEYESIMAIEYWLEDEI